MKNIYTNGKYLESNKTWHTEDSPWKASQVMRIIDKNDLFPQGIVEIGCGAGRILEELSRQESLRDVHFSGYDISPQAIELCKNIESEKVKYVCQDLLSEENCEHFDILLAMDVFEHVPDYMGFLEKCRSKADYKIYHIPLDIHAAFVLINGYNRCRYTLGHLHYFTADTAIATLKDTGHEIVDSFYTNGAFGLFKQHPSFIRALANGPRWLLSRFSVPFTARLLGGYSLLVLAK